MGEPWATLLTALVPAAVVAWIANVWKARIEQEGAGDTRADARLRVFLDLQGADNARLRVEVAQLTKDLRESDRIADLWWQAARRQRHDRNNDRHLANLVLASSKLPPIEWSPIPPHPGFEEIT